jgi:hypothetical protein
MKKFIEKINKNLETRDSAGNMSFLDNTGMITEEAYLNFACRVFKDNLLVEEFKEALNSINEVKLLTSDEMQQAYPILALLQEKSGVDTDIKFTGIFDAKERFLYSQDALFQNIDEKIKHCINKNRLDAAQREGFKVFLEAARDKFIPSAFVSRDFESTKVEPKPEIRVEIKQEEKSDIDQLLEIFKTIKGAEPIPSEEDKKNTLELLNKLQNEVKKDTKSGRWVRQACRELEGREATFSEILKDYTEIVGEKAMSILAILLLNAIFNFDFFKKNSSYEISDDLKEKLTQLQSDFKEVKGRFSQKVMTSEKSPTPPINHL